MSELIAGKMAKAPIANIDLAGMRVGVGNVSNSSMLGGYYLDLRSALSLVESGYHGPLDESGAPLVSSHAAAGFYNITIVAQYALALHDKMIADGRTADLERKLSAQLEVIVGNVEREAPWKGFFLHGWPNPKYRQLGVPWLSALAQGNAVSALLRSYQLQGDERLLDSAALAFDALDRPLSEGGTRVLDKCGHLWFEEYPMNPPSHVLNGFIFVLWGILDYARVTGARKAWDWWEAGVETLRAHIADFDCGYWSVYDLESRELASLYYQTNIHAPQLEVMYLLTGDAVFKRYAERWTEFSASLWRRTLWWINLRVQARMKRLRSLRSGKRASNN